MRVLGEATGPLEASVFVEGLRAIPAAFVGIALVIHALLWAIATQIAEPSPPPQMAVAISLGREWLTGYAELPPLAAWSSAAIYHVTHSLFAIRLAAALCVAGAGWILFLFARRIAGDRHGAISVLLMISVFPVAFPGSSLTNDLLQMPLAAGAILFWWLAAGERKPNSWVALGVVLGAMLYAGPQAFVLLVAFVAVTLFSARGRAAISRVDALLCIVLASIVFASVAWPRLLWLSQNGVDNLFAGAGAGISADETFSPLRLPFSIIAGHFGFALLLFLASTYSARAKENAPSFIREPVKMFSRRSVIALAIVPAVLALVLLYAFDQNARLQFFAPLLMLSGVAAVLMGGERLIVRRQRLVGAVAFIFLFAAPIAQIVLSFAPGWLGDNKAANWPAGAAARTFTEIYHTRTGRPLDYIIGERVYAAQIAVVSSDHPHIFIDADLSRAPWIDDVEFKKKGGVLFWQIRGADPSPPADYVAKLPAFVAEAPLRLPWARGGGDPVRLGWAIVPPR